MGLMIDTITAEAERYTGENLTSRDLSSRVASGVVRISGLGFVTNARRLGFSMTMMDTIGHLTRRYSDVTKLKAEDYRVLASKGISQETWDIWRAARLDNWGANHTLLTPDAIMGVEGVSPERKRQAVIDLLGIVREEQDLAVIAPGARERTQMQFGTEAGTPLGELARSAVLFKSFPWTVLQRNLERASAMETEYGRAAYLASLFIFMTAGGAAANWIKDMLAGKDPRTMNAFSRNPRERSIAIRNWMQAGLSGGALGIYGDFLFAETQPYSGNSLAETMMGPNIGTASQVLGLTVGNAAQALQGEETNIGSEAVRVARGITPGANLWYTRALTDRLIFNQLQDMADPGAVDRMQSRQRRMQATDYWWEPSSNPAEGEWPERGPELPN
jgi:hypothetical protein